MESNRSCEDGNSSLCANDLAQSESPNSSVGAVGDVGVASEGNHEGTVHDWPSIRQELQWAFPVHIYGFACLFFMLAFYTFFSILNLRSQISSRPFMSTINVFLCVLGVTRAACFLIDPYTSGQVMPGFLGSVMWDVGYPCILSAFSLIQLAFSQLTQVKFRPETLRRKSALSLLITTHFALVLAADIVTAFENHLQVVRWVVQTVFLSWGLVLCVTFLYGGTRIIRMLRTIPHTAFQTSDTNAPNNKGILQLALLAQCNNIASSVLTAAAPSILTPKIRITDEFDQTYSYVSEGSRVSSLHPSDPDLAPPSRRASARASFSRECEIVAASTSGVRMYGECSKDITEEDEDCKSVNTPIDSPGHTIESCATKTLVKTSSRNSEKTYTETNIIHDFDNDHRKTVREPCESFSDRIPEVIIRVEEVESPETEDACEIRTDTMDNSFQNETATNKSKNKASSGVDVKNAIQSNDNKESSHSNLKGIIQNASSARSIDSVLTHSENSTLDSPKGCNDSVGQNSFVENNDKSESINTNHSVNSESADNSLKIGNGENVIPKRKKSLTWCEETQTIEPTNEKEKPVSTKSNINSDDCEKVPRDTARRASTSSRRNSRANSEKTRGRNYRSGDIIDGMGRRRSSTISTCSNRKSSGHWQTIPPPYRREHRSPSASSASGSRRNSRRSIKDEAEVEALLSHTPDGRTDVTLASILNHIAYVNQTASASKLPTALKDSRKAQVQQVLVVTYVTAALGTILSLALVYGLYGHFNSLAVLTRPPWLWFTYESSCRFLEFLMGCAMANITRQPVNRHPQYPHALRLKQRNSIYM